MKIDEDSPSPTPAWVLTYGDLMSLLLTIFVMLVSMGELKQTDKFQGVADSLQAQFGYAGATASQLPGELRPRSPTLAAAATAFRTIRAAAMTGDSVGINHSRDSVSPAATIFIDDPARELSDANRAELRRAIGSLVNDRKVIEIRGYALQPDNSTTASQNSWDEAFVGARSAAGFLTAGLGIDPARIRVWVASQTASPPADQLSSNAQLRVDVWISE